MSRVAGRALAASRRASSSLLRRWCWRVAAPGSGGAARRPGTGPLPLLGVADPEMTLMGAAPGRRAGRGLGLPPAAARRRRGRRSARGSSTSGRLRTRPARPAARLPAPHRRHRLAGLRHAGRRSRATPTAGRSRTGSRRGSRRDGRRRAGRPRPAPPAGEQVVVLDHDPGGDWRALRAAAADGPAAGRRRSGRRRRSPTNRASARSPSPPSTRAARTGLFFAPDRAARSPTAIVHFDGDGMEARAGRAAGRLGDALPHPRDRRDRARQRLGARRSRRPALDRSRRPARAHLDPGRAALGRAAARRGTPFADATTPARGSPARRRRRRRAAADRHRRTASGSTSRRRSKASPRDVTLFYDSGADAVTGSWCDARALRRRRSASSSRARAATAASPGRAAGSAPGSITNPLDPGGERGKQPRHLPALRRRRLRADAGRRRQLPPQRRLRRRRQRLARGAGRDLARRRRRPACGPGRSRCARR